MFRKHTEMMLLRQSFIGLVSMGFNLIQQNIPGPAIFYTFSSVIVNNFPIRYPPALVKYYAAFASYFIFIFFVSNEKTAKLRLKIHLLFEKKVKAKR